MAQGESGDNVVGVLAFDLSSAFDTVDKAQLIPKLAALGIKGTALSWFESNSLGIAMVMEDSRNTEMCLSQGLVGSNGTVGSDPQCSIEFGLIALNSVFIYVTVMIHVYVKFCSRPRNAGLSPKGALPGPAAMLVGHNAIWILMLLGLLLSVSAFMEVVLIYAKRDILLLVSVFETTITLITALLIPVYFNAIEGQKGQLFSLATMAFLPLIVQFLGTSILLLLRSLQLSVLSLSTRHLIFITTLFELGVNTSLFLILVFALGRRMYLQRGLTSKPKPRRPHRRPPLWPRSVSTSGRAKMAPDEEEPQCVYRYNQVSFVSKVTFSWLLPLLRRGYQIPLELVDLHKLPPEEKARRQYEKLKACVPAPEKMVLQACLIMNWKLILLGGFFRFWSDIFGLVGALSIKFIVNSISEDFDLMLAENATMTSQNGSSVWPNNTKPLSHDSTSLYSNHSADGDTAQALTLDEFFADSFVIALIIFLAALGQGAFSQTSSHLLSVAGVRSKNALHVLLYEKALRLPFLTGKLMSDNNKRIFQAQDFRLYKSTEAMQGMKTVKLGCLEEAMFDKIEDARNRELKFLRRDSFFWSIMAFLASVSTIIVTTVTVGLYVALEDTNFSAANIFSALALLGQLTVCLSVFPVTIPIFIKGLVSRSRLLEFFSRTEVSIYKDSSSTAKKASQNSRTPGGEMDPEDDEEDEEGEEGDGLSNIEEEREFSDSQSRTVVHDSRKGSCQNNNTPATNEHFPEVAFSIQNGTFAWPKTNVNTLRDINLEVKTGSLTIVIGPSGSGKTALISALTEEMERLRGYVKWHLPPTVALTGQKPWLLNASIRDNILLGRPFKEKRYDKVLRVCDLRADLDLLPEGDETEVGERGVLLSGGQRHRIAIARCIYSKAPCTFLDSPFSSLDSSITTHIFHEGILGILLKRRRTVFMATDRVDFLNRADWVIYMNQGSIKAQGSVGEVMKHHPELRISIKHIISRTSTLSSDEGLVEGKTAQERWKLLRNVTLFMKQMQKARLLKDTKTNKSSFSRNVSMLKKNTSASKLARAHMRIDSSSQLNLCHDILLPSDECADTAGLFEPGSGLINLPRSDSKQGQFGSLRRAGLRKFRTRSGSSSTGSHKLKSISRASSWSTSFNNSIPMNTPRQHSGPTGSLMRKPVGGVGNSNTSIGLIRQAAVNHPPLPILTPSSSIGGGVPRIGRGPAQHQGEFQRMRSFHHMLAFKNRLVNSGSSASLPKHSASEPDGFSFDSQPNFRSRSTSRQNSYQESAHSSSGINNHPSIYGNPLHARVMRMTSNASAISQISGFSDDFHDDDEDDGLILTREPSSQEKREYGQIGINVYSEYFNAGGLHYAAMFLILSIALQSIKVYMDFLLRDWSLEAGSLHDSVSMSFFTWYSSFSVLVLVLSCSANLIGQLIGARARRNLHFRMLTNLLRCPLDLFEAHPIGRIINRFSYDMFVVDQKLPACVQRLVLVSLICVSALVVNSIQSPIFIVFAIPMIAIYWWLQHYYRHTSRELQRLDSISRAPVLSHFSDTLGGLKTIRAFREQNRFINQLCEKIDTNTTSFLILQSGCRWLGVALDFTGAVMVFVSIIINLLVSYQYPGERSSASIGLSMNYSLLVPIYLAWVIKFLADIENYMNAVERVLEYTDLCAEEDFQSGQNLADDLSNEGSIRFDNVSLTHSLDLRAITHSLSLEVPTRQKIGICGRSGAGKSTLVMSLSRVTKVLQGRITINDVDITHIPLKNLRRFIWTVPQDVTLFSGTLKSNLDPEDLFTETEIWASLDKIGLRDMIQSLPFGLDSEVIENGDNFSLGQKQELGLARAVLLNPPIVVLDEATSALDPAREIQLHKCLLAAFANSTLISVAHRLANIIPYDRVLVMGDGRILEDGSPRELLKKPMGFFSSLWRAAGEKPL
eukprot:snap_masked-scaffold595_size129005-processed-gene-0.7 protein:Tk09125 transcript:snap_masked-scaffold595_size129005-processed-gene-0.7-mRNA-1 annotation:"cystic fibrosis transmembrane conductance regulator"